MAIVTVRLVIGRPILARRHLLTIVLLVLLFALNWVCTRYMPAINIWLSGLLRSLLIVVAAWAAYKLKLSPEINEVLHRVRI